MKYNEEGQVQCPICHQYVEVEDLWEEKGVTACDECVADGKAPEFYK